MHCADWDLIERLTPSRISAIQRVAKRMADSVGKAAADPNEPPPMNEEEFMRRFAGQPMTL